MSKQTLKYFGLMAVVGILSLALSAFAPLPGVSAAGLDRYGGPGGRGSAGGNGVGTQGTGLALTPLSDAEVDALQKSILEEYGALNLYQGAIDQFGSVYPFSVIVRSEQQHVKALVRQAEKYGVEVPANPGLAVEPAFASLAEACQAGVDAEIADAALYDELKLVVPHSDIVSVFDKLQSASLNSHLQAFQTCQ